jgi:hypothetical protein
VTELYVDGVRVGRSSRPNFRGRSILNVRAGLVSLGIGAQTRDVSLRLDRVTLSPCQVGPREWG